MLTKTDLKQIELIVEEKTKHLPSKNEFFDWMDKLMGEIWNMRDELSIVVGYKDQIEDHEERIEKLEKKAHVS